MALGFYVLHAMTDEWVYHGLAASLDAPSLSSFEPFIQRLFVLTRFFSAWDHGVQKATCITVTGVLFLTPWPDLKSAGHFQRTD